MASWSLRASAIKGGKVAAELRKQKKAILESQPGGHVEAQIDGAIAAVAELVKLVRDDLVDVSVSGSAASEQRDHSQVDGFSFSVIGAV